jgi:photosystem II stability/assembly factor-like uncharacterized protein
MRSRSPMLIVAIALLLVILVASSAPVRSEIQYGRWRDISPVDYSDDLTGGGTLRGVYMRSGQSGAIGSGDGWTVGGDGSHSIIAHYDGFSWQLRGSPVANGFYTSVHFCTSPAAPSVGLCSPNGDGSDGWIVGTDGTNAQALYYFGYQGSTALSQESNGLGQGILNSIFLACHTGSTWSPGCSGGTGGLAFAVGSTNAYCDVTHVCSSGSGLLYHFTGNPFAGGGWVVDYTDSSTPAYYSVYMYSDGTTVRGFAVGNGGHWALYGSGAWTLGTVSGASDLYGVFVDQANPVDAWAVGAVVSGQNAVWHYTSGAWSPDFFLPSGGSAVDLRGIFMPSSSEIWVVGKNGAIFHSTDTGHTWSQVSAPQNPIAPTGTTINLQAVSLDASSSGWAVGSYGVILHTTNSNCGPVSGPCWGGSTSITQTAQLRTVFEVSSTDAWAGGYYDGGATTLIHWDGNKWHRVTVPSLYFGNTPDIYGIYMSGSSDGWAVGRASGDTYPVFLHWDGSSWSPPATMPSCGYSTCGMRSVFMISSSEGWAVGTKANILYYTGGQWSPCCNSIAGTSTYTLNSVFINNPGTNQYAGWAVGDGGTLLYLNQAGGRIWTQMTLYVQAYTPVAYTGNLNSVFFTDSQHGWIVGDQGAIFFTSDGGNTWSGGPYAVTGAPLNTKLTSVFIDSPSGGAGSGDGWAVGLDTGNLNAVFAHWNGGIWETISPAGVLPAGLGLNSVYLRSAVDGFAVGYTPIQSGVPVLHSLAGIFHLDPPNPGQVGQTTQVTYVTSSQATVTSTSVTSVTVTPSITASSTQSMPVSTIVVTVTPTVTSTVSSTTQQSSSAYSTTQQSSSVSLTTPLALPPVPGFPWESIIAGIIFGIALLGIARSRRRSH